MWPGWRKVVSGGSSAILNLSNILGTLIIFTLRVPRLGPGPALYQSIFNPNASISELPCYLFPQILFMIGDWLSSIGAVWGTVCCHHAPVWPTKELLDLCWPHQKWVLQRSAKKMMSWLKTEGQDNGLTWEIPINMETLPSAQNRTHDPSDILDSRPPGPYRSPGSSYKILVQRHSRRVD